MTLTPEHAARARRVKDAYKTRQELREKVAVYLHGIDLSKPCDSYALADKNFEEFKANLSAEELDACLRQQLANMLSIHKTLVLKGETTVPAPAPVVVPEIPAPAEEPKRWFQFWR